LPFLLETQLSTTPTVSITTADEDVHLFSPPSRPSTNQRKTLSGYSLLMNFKAKICAVSRWNINDHSSSSHSPYPDRLLRIGRLLKYAKHNAKVLTDAQIFLVQHITHQKYIYIYIYIYIYSCYSKITFLSCSARLLKKAGAINAYHIIFVSLFPTVLWSSDHQHGHGDECTYLRVSLGKPSYITSKYLHQIQRGYTDTKMA
jgi:hypothetical protein